VETAPDSKAPPAIWLHIQKVYEAMDAQASLDDEMGVEMTPGGEANPFKTGAKIKRYEGFTSHLFQELGIAVPNYGPVLDLLREMGCITQERRGGGPSPSVWRLWKKPTLADFELAHKTMPQVQVKVRKEQHEEQRILDLQKQLGGIDVPQALVELQNQINVLKADLKEHERNLHGHTEPYLEPDNVA
jgi:hypothetical protein